MADLTADRFGHFQTIGALLPALTYVDQLRVFQTGLHELFNYLLLLTQCTMFVCLPWSDKTRPTHKDACPRTHAHTHTHTHTRARAHTHTCTRAHLINHSTSCFVISDETCACLVSGYGASSVMRVIFPSTVSCGIRDSSKPGATLGALLQGPNSSWVLPASP
jgi:hypothetical protein